MQLAFPHYSGLRAQLILQGRLGNGPAVRESLIHFFELGVAAFLSFYWVYLLKN